MVDQGPREPEKYVEVDGMLYKKQPDMSYLDDLSFLDEPLRKLRKKKKIQRHVKQGAATALVCFLFFVLQHRDEVEFQVKSALTGEKERCWIHRNPSFQKGYDRVSVTCSFEGKILVEPEDMDKVEFNIESGDEAELDMSIPTGKKIQVAKITRQQVHTIN